MLYTTVALSYSAANIILAVMILIRYRQALLSKFYAFCVGCLVVIAFCTWLLPQVSDPALRTVLRSGAVFLYAVFPFFFIHFVVIFVRRYEILRSRLVIFAIYFTGLFSYAMILMKLIPEPILPDGSVAETGYIFFLTWMTIFFTIGIAMLYEIARGFYEKVGRTNILLAAFIVLLLLLPGPFTQTLFFDILKVGSAGYYLSSLVAVAMAVYFIFRHKIIVNTFYDSLKSALSVINDVIITTNEEFQIEMVTGGVGSLLGYADGALHGKPLLNYISPANRVMAFRDGVMAKRIRGSVFDIDFLKRDGTTVPMNFSFVPMMVDAQVTGFVGVGRDMTEQRKIEEQLRERDKLESLGTLAAGIAHDFNNILQILLMNNSMPGDENGHIDADQLRKRGEVNRSAIERGKALVRQVLTFARKTTANFRPLQLNDVVADCVKMMATTFPKTIRIHTQPGSGLPHVLADENQVSQVIMNLTLNARDAMPGGGEITIVTGIESGSVLVDRYPDARRTDYVRLTVTDNGAGMDGETLKKIFEPFFTTKGRGKGTGLGLAVVYGIVGSHQGFIETRSTPGKGTTVDIFMPVTVEREAAGEEPEHPPTESRALRGTVLIVEDEEMILESVTDVLQRAGYVCLKARDGLEGLETWKNNRDRIQVVLLDIDLPKMGGWDVLRRMRDIDEGSRVILCSGYFDPGVRNMSDGKRVNEYLAKPYSEKEVLESVERVLNLRTAIVQ
jgi:two-component system cell cycle sensor histidine kinase/response regulator CckA